MTKNEQLRLKAIKSIARDYVDSYRGTSMDRELVAIEIAALDHGSPDCEDHTLFVELLPEWARQWYLHGETDLADRLGSGPQMVADGDAPCEMYSAELEHIVEELCGEDVDREPGWLLRALTGIPSPLERELRATCRRILDAPDEEVETWPEYQALRVRPVDVLSPDPVPWTPPPVWLHVLKVAAWFAWMVIIVIWASGGRVTL